MSAVCHSRSSASFEPSSLNACEGWQRSQCGPQAAERRRSISPQTRRTPGPCPSRSHAQRSDCQQGPPHTGSPQRACPVYTTHPWGSERVPVRDSSPGLSVSDGPLLWWQKTSVSQSVSRTRPALTPPPKKVNVNVPGYRYRYKDTGGSRDTHGPDIL